MPALLDASKKRTVASNLFSEAFVRVFRWVFGPCLALAAAVFPYRASAQQPMEFALWRLATVQGTSMPCASMRGTARTCIPNYDAWRSLASQAAGAHLPPLLAPAMTTGYAGLYLGIETWITDIQSGAPYWQDGTIGNAASMREGFNTSPKGPLAWTRINVRKGLPFGFEIGTSLGLAPMQGLWTVGAEVKWALLEGFRTGVGYAPDIAVRGAVQTWVGSPEFHLTVPAIDLILSKPFSIGGEGTISPFVSGQMAWVFADTELVDLTPDIDPTAAGNVSDYDNNVVFPSLRSPRYRATLGFEAACDLFRFSASFSLDLLSPHEADAVLPAALPRQWTASAGMGAQFR